MPKKKKKQFSPCDIQLNYDMCHVLFMIFKNHTWIFPHHIIMPTNTSTLALFFNFLIFTLNTSGKIFLKPNSKEN
jgi:hypothetical protein